MELRDINWEIEKRESIEECKGKVNGILFFTATRYKQDDWILTSNIIPMEMQHHPTMYDVEFSSSTELFLFLMKIIIF
jgi:hypothetical protein